MNSPDPLRTIAHILAGPLFHYAPVIRLLLPFFPSIEYNDEHKCLVLRHDLHPVPLGQIEEIEIYLPPRPGLYVGLSALPGQRTSRRGLVPLTIAGLRRALRDLRRQQAAAKAERARRSRINAATQRRLAKRDAEWAAGPGPAKHAWAVRTLESFSQQGPK